MKKKRISLSFLQLFHLQTSEQPLAPSLLQEKSFVNNLFVL